MTKGFVFSLNKVNMENSQMAEKYQDIFRLEKEDIVITDSYGNVELIYQNPGTYQTFGEPENNPRSEWNSLIYKIRNSGLGDRRVFSLGKPETLDFNGNMPNGYGEVKEYVGENFPQDSPPLLVLLKEYCRTRDVAITNLAGSKCKMETGSISVSKNFV